MLKIKSISTTDLLWNKAKIVAKSRNMSISKLFNNYIVSEYSKLMKIPLTEELLKEMSKNEQR